jgi:hypothetical protein
VVLISKKSRNMCQRLNARHVFLPALSAAELTPCAFAPVTKASAAAQTASLFAAVHKAIKIWHTMWFPMRSVQWIQH